MNITPEELKQMDSEQIIRNLVSEVWDAGCVTEDINTIVGDYEDELLLRLSNNNINEYKKRLITKVNNLVLPSDNQGIVVNFNWLIDLINNQD